MPNYVRNLVKAYGENASEVIDALIRPDEDIDLDEMLHGPEYPQDVTVDFNLLIPMPEDLDIGDVPYVDWSSLDLDNIIEIALNPNASDARKRYVEKVSRMLYNKSKHGFFSWYDWRIAHWGTKSNAMHATRLSVDQIVFDTAWEPAIPVIQELSYRFPDNRIILDISGEVEMTSVICFPDESYDEP